MFVFNHGQCRTGKQLTVGHEQEQILGADFPTSAGQVSVHVLGYYLILYTRYGRNSGVCWTTGGTVVTIWVWIIIGSLGKTLNQLSRIVHQMGYASFDCRNTSLLLYPHSVSFPLVNPSNVGLYNVYIDIGIVLAAHTGSIAFYRTWLVGLSWACSL